MVAESTARASDLTVHLAKAEALGRLPALAQGLSAVASSTDSVTSWLWHHGLLLIKPDLAVCPDKAGSLLRKLQRNGFEVAGFAVTSLSRQRVFELRRFNALFTTLLGAEASVISQTVGPSVPVVLRDTRPMAYVPAAVRLNMLKPVLRDDLTEAPESMGGLHVSDEPIDVAHELAAVLTPDEIRALVVQSSMESSFMSELIAALKRLSHSSPTHQLSGEKALRRIRGLNNDHEKLHGTSMLSQEVDLFCGRALGGATLDFRRLFWLLEEAGVEIDPWTAFAATSVLFDRFRWPKAPESWVGGASPDDWLAKRRGAEDPLPPFGELRDSGRSYEPISYVPDAEDVH